MMFLKHNNSYPWIYNTYEELKLKAPFMADNLLPGIYNTYEELKLYHAVITRSQGKQGFIIPMRN